MKKSNWMHGEHVTLESVLADPIVRLVMAADKVSADDLISLAQSLGHSLQANPSSGALGEYRAGVGIMLLNEKNHIFVGQRADVAEAAWQMPQGGIKAGETPTEAAFREMKEEIGTDKAIVLAESKDWFFYDLPAELAAKARHGRWRGQRQKWLVMRFLGTDQDIDLAADSREFSSWKWIRPEELPDLIVSFKRSLYTRLLAEFDAIIVGNEHKPDRING